MNCSSLPHWLLLIITCIFSAGTLSAQNPATQSRCADAEQTLFRTVINYTSRTAPDLNQLNRWYLACPAPNAELRAAFHLLRCAFFVYEPGAPLEAALEDGNEAFHAANVAKNAAPSVNLPGYESAFYRIAKELETELNQLARQGMYYRGEGNRSVTQPATSDEWVKQAPVAPAQPVQGGFTMEQFQKKSIGSPAAPQPEPVYEASRGMESEPFGYVGSLDSISPRGFIQWVNRPRSEPSVNSRSVTSAEAAPTPGPDAQWATAVKGISLQDTLLILTEPVAQAPAIGMAPWGSSLLLLGERRFVPEDRRFYERVRLNSGELGWIPSGYVAQADQVAVLTREMPAFDVNEQGQTQVLRMLEAGSLLAISDRNGDWVRIDAPYLGVSGWIADPSVLSLSTIDREIAFRLAAVKNLQNQFSRNAELIEITRIPGFSESPLAPEVNNLLYRYNRP